MNRRDFLAASSAIATLSVADSLGGPANGAVLPDLSAEIDLTRTATHLPHFWKEAAGSDRTVVGLREQWRQDLVRVHRETGIKAIRSHGLFNDEMGIAARGAGNFNFLYVDQIYDFMLDHGVRPFVELSFMPEALASSNNRVFFYKGNISPPRDWNEWRQMVEAFTAHVVKRYGIAEVSGWKFEVWNEPNISFWAGSQEQYFELYRQSAQAVKAIDSRLQVGGPATAQLAWIPDLIRYCRSNSVPLDFLTTHVYANDPQEALFGQANKYPFEEVIPRGLEMVKGQIAESAMPDLPLWLTEWSSQNPAFIVDTIRNCIGMVEAMSYWTFSNAFEELGPPSLFNGTFGLLDQYGIARPSLHAFTFLNKIGERRLDAGSGPLLVTVRKDGSLAIVVWNLIHTKNGGQVASGNPVLASSGGFNGIGPNLNLRIALKGWNGRRSGRISQVNARTGTALPAWMAMGSPEYPTRDEIESLRRAAELPPPARVDLSGESVATLDVSVAANGVALIELDA